jgi:hypothetical protein
MATITHRTIVELRESVPAQAEAGTDLRLNVRVACGAGCDLRGAPIAVLAGQETIASAGLSSYDGTGNGAENLWLKAPGTVGEHVWTVVFHHHETETVAHEESALAVSFKTVPHTTSMAIWDVPSSPVPIDHPFTVMIGVKCSARCALGGQTVVVTDDSGMRMGQGMLSEAPWPGTVALYVAEVPLVAPPTAGTPAWTGGFATTDLPLPHDEASAAFTFRAAARPEHEVRIRVTDKETSAPIGQVEIRCGCYCASTNSDGLATLQLPAGRYDVNAWKLGYDDAEPTTVEVTMDLLLDLETAPTPKPDPDAERVWM